MMLRLETHVIVFQPRVPASYHTTFWKKKKKAMSPFTFNHLF